MTEYGSTVTRSPRRAKLKAIEQLAIIETTTPPAKTVKKSTRSKVGQLLDAVLTPLTTRGKLHNWISASHSGISTAGDDGMY